MFGQVGYDFGVKQEIVIIGFVVFDGVGGVCFVVGDILLLGVVDKVVDLVFGLLVVYFVVDGKDIVQIVVGLQEWCDIGNIVFWVVVGCVD